MAITEQSTSRRGVPDGFVDDAATYLSQPFPSLPSPLPDKDPSSENYQSNVFTTARNANRPGYTQNWNLTVQYLLPKQTVLEVAYIGNKGTRLWGGINTGSELDGLPASLLASMGDTLNAPVSQYPQYMPYASFPTTNKVAQALRPYPQYYGVEEAFPYNSNSTYNSMQASVTAITRWTRFHSIVHLVQGDRHFRRYGSRAIQQHYPGLHEPEG